MERETIRIRPWRFSLRTAFVLMTLAAVFIVVVQRRMRIDSVVNALVSQGANVEYHPGVIPGLSRWTGHFFSDVSSVNLQRAQIADEDLKNIYQLRRLERLNLAGTKIGLDGIEHLTRNTSLRRLALWSCPRIHDHCFESLSKLKHLEVLDIHDTPITGRGIGNASKLPALKHLIFSARVQSDEEKWMGADQILALRGIRATPVAATYLHEISDDGLREFASWDNARTTSLIIRDGSISRIGIESLRSIPLEKLNFQRCPLTSDDLDGLDWSSVSHEVTFHGSTLSLADFILRAGSDCLDLELTGNRCTFIFQEIPGESTAKWPLRIRYEESGSQITAELLRSMPKLKLLSCDQSMFPAVLPAIEGAQAAIHLNAVLPENANRDGFWNTIERTPSLTGLSVWNAPQKTTRFTPEHQLENLVIRRWAGQPSPFVADADFFHQVAKLPKLEFLWVQNGNVLGDEVRPLQKMEALTFIRMDHFSNAAVNQLVGMKLNTLDLNLTYGLSDEVVEKLLQAPYAVELNEVRLDLPDSSSR